MSHEPECPTGQQFPNQIVVECYECGRLRVAYQRGREDAAHDVASTMRRGILDSGSLGSSFGVSMERLGDHLVAAARGEDA